MSDIYRLGCDTLRLWSGVVCREGQATTVSRGEAHELVAWEKVIPRRDGRDAGCCRGDEERSDGPPICEAENV